MRIAVWHNLPFGGAKRALFNHLKALKEEGHYLEIWDLGLHNDNILDFTQFGKINSAKFIHGFDQMHVQYKYPRSISETKRIIGLLKSIQKKCAEQINSQSFDIVFVNSCSVSYMPFIGEYLKPSSVLYLGEPYRWLYEASPNNLWQAPEGRLCEIKNIFNDYRKTYSRRIQVKQEIDSAKTYSKILVNSHYSKESVLRAYGLETSVCYLGVDTVKFYNSGIKKGNYVVGLGLLYPPKGVDRAIILLSRLSKSIRPPLLWISNGIDQVYLNYLEELSTSLEVDLKVIINIPESELIEKLTSARFMLYTSRLEPFGLAPLEANACGTFVIGIAEAGIRETISNGINGFLISDINDQCFIQYAESLLRDSHLATSLGIQARKHVTMNWSLNQLRTNIVKAITI